MQLRPLGTTNLRIPPVVFGAMARRTRDDATREQLVREAVAQGLTAIDTAPLYDFGRSEKQIGRALRGVAREQVQLLGKVGLRWQGDTHGRVLFSFNDAHGRRIHVRRDSRPASLREEIDQSLARLQVDYLDLVQIHHPDLDVPLADSLGTLVELRQAGKLREIGVSNFSRAQLEAARLALGDVPLCSLQPEYSLLQRDIETDLLPLCHRHGIGVLAYSPLAGGVLAGRLPAGVDPAALQRLDQASQQTLLPIASAHACSAAAVALAWVIAQPGMTAAIVGASDMSQLRAQREALELVLEEAEISALTQAFSTVAWPRLWEQQDSRLRRLWRGGRRLGGRLARRLGLIPHGVR